MLKTIAAPSAQLVDFIEGLGLSMSQPQHRHGRSATICPSPTLT